MSDFMQYAASVIALLGILAFLVSCVVEVIKNLPYLSKVPTDAVVLILSLVFTVVGLLAYLSYAGIQVMWYYVACAIIVAFLVAFIAMYGWEKFSDMWARFKGKELK